MGRSKNSYGWHYPGGGWGDSNGPRNDPDYFKRQEQQPKKEQVEVEPKGIKNPEDLPKGDGFSPTPRN